MSLLLVVLVLNSANPPAQSLRYLIFEKIEDVNQVGPGPQVIGKTRWTTSLMTHEVALKQTFLRICSPKLSNESTN